jgi:two-component system, OmpR family, KDP operon response regulator KdpE
MDRGISSSARPVILVIEDDQAIRRVLKASLSAINALVHEADSMRAGLSAWRARRPDLVILDLGLPDGDGLQVIREIRKSDAVPMIVLSARSGETQKIEALDAGADDYLTKPVSYAELLARIRVAFRHVTRHRSGNVPTIFINGPLAVNLQDRDVQFYGQKVLLTPIQFRLLQVLVLNAGKVVTHPQLLREVWGNAHRGKGHYLRVYMSQLRAKLEEDPTNPKRFLTEAGIGYRLLPDSFDQKGGREDCEGKETLWPVRNTQKLD